jgi:hypothetical protein
MQAHAYKMFEVIVLMISLSIITFRVRDSYSATGNDNWSIAAGQEHFEQRPERKEHLLWLNQA